MVKDVNWTLASVPKPFSEERAGSEQCWVAWFPAQAGQALPVSYTEQLQMGGSTVAKQGSLQTKRNQSNYSWIIDSLTVTTKEKLIYPK